MIRHLLRLLRLRPRCAHDGRIVPRRYHLLEADTVVEIGVCERCGSSVAS